MGPFDYSVSEFGIKDTSNTDIFALNGDLVSLWYNAGNPIALDPITLETRKAFHLDGRDKPKMSAHSKIDWNTGELLYFDYNDAPPYMTYGVANAKGEVIHEVPIDYPVRVYRTISALPKTTRSCTTCRSSMTSMF